VADEPSGLSLATPQETKKKVVYVVTILLKHKRFINAFKNCIGHMAPNGLTIVHDALGKKCEKDLFGLFEFPLLKELKK
jgi:hypothetical protein